MTDELHRDGDCFCENEAADQMRREHERQARRQTYLASQSNYWTPKGMTLDEYFKAVSQHPPIAEILDYLEKNSRACEEFAFAKSKDGICEKCSVRTERDLSTDLKSSSRSLNGEAEVQFSRYAAERFAASKEPIVLTPNLHREFVYQSWVEAAHLEHIKEHRDEPGIAALEAHAEIENGELSLALSIRAIDGSHRAALTYKEGRPFVVRLLSPVESLKSMFSINNKKNPFFAVQYAPEVDRVLEQMARGEVGSNTPLKGTNRDLQGAKMRTLETARGKKTGGCMKSPHNSAGGTHYDVLHKIEYRNRTFSRVLLHSVDRQPPQSATCKTLFLKGRER